MMETTGNDDCRRLLKPLKRKIGPEPILGTVKAHQDLSQHSAWLVGGNRGSHD